MEIHARTETRAPAAPSPPDPGGPLLDLQDARSRSARAAQRGNGLPKGADKRAMDRHPASPSCERMAPFPQLPARLACLVWARASRMSSCSESEVTDGRSTWGPSGGSRGIGGKE